jgi:hypothetical protein
MPRWATAHPDTFIGDATKLIFDSSSFDAVVTSPCYANRMADHHDNGDKCSECKGTGQAWPGDGTVRGLYPNCMKCSGSGLSPRRSYKHYYGDGFFADATWTSNAGAMQWGDEYRELHAKAWAEVYRVLRPSDTPSLLLNIKDHIRNGKRVRVSAWHRRTILDIGFTELGRWDIPTSGYGYGDNHSARVPNEYVYVFTKEH